MVGYGGNLKNSRGSLMVFSKNVYVRHSDLFSNLEKPEEIFEEFLNFAADIDCYSIFVNI